MTDVDVLIPTIGRAPALAVTLTALLGQTERSFRVVISDQGEPEAGARHPVVDAVVRVLEARGHVVERHDHRPPRGMAEQRQFLLDRATTPFALMLDDDVLLEPTLLARLLRAIRRERCGFVGAGLIGLSHVGDERPSQETIEFWAGPVRPERIEPGGPEWPRHHLHSAANLEHAARRLGARPGEDDRLYKVAWVGGCVLYDVAALRSAGGFDFWSALPETHAGEDVLAQLRVMARSGGAGLFPSGAYHLELPTTIPDREVDAPFALTELVRGAA